MAEEKGVRRTDLLAASGIRNAQLSHPENLVTGDQFAELCRQALSRTGDPGLGLEFGLRLKFTTHGAMSQAAVSCDTLGQAIQVLMKYLHIRFAFLSMELSIEDDEAVVDLDILHDMPELYRFNLEVFLAALLDVSNLLVGPRLFEGSSCRVKYSRPEGVALYTTLFGEDIFFNSGVNQLRFHKSCLELPMLLANPVARRVAEAECEEQSRKLRASSSVAQQVLQLLESIRDGRLMGLEEVAAKLRVSSRTLRRQLATEGARFQDLQDKVRHHRALDLMRDNGQMSIDEIAERLGYSDPSNFSRAFKKWEGVSPSAWRNLHVDPPV
ncbi:HTH-type transcriptional regulator VirS [Marinobacter litoralis]|uniref:HTH-type transcriptional regulator VirS n=1 Tax=Marinobacter litoralis TaxID=187981 RepID=A0A3M2RBB0_9GAMM|nr:AraC family transcriptional regulator [Marinobacter litoralis]RMJ02577.1 HTH-type transcriptional regulator VirS [Marinobacter litoralis]